MMHNLPCGNPYFVFPESDLSVSVAGVVPTVSTEVFFRKADGFDQVVQSLELERVEPQVLPHGFNHLFVLVGIRILVWSEYFFSKV